MTSKELEFAAEFIRNSVATECDSDPLAHIRFTEALTRRAAQRAKSRRIAVAGATCLVAVAAFVTFSALRPQVVTYRTDGSSETGVLGSYVSAPPQTPLGLRFSEGSRVVLLPYARGRVSHASRHGATMVLEDGRAHAEIVHRADTNWRVLAGPFVVDITGTTFDVAFDVATQAFELKMQSGTVRVTGPGLAQPVEVGGSQRLVLSAKGAETPVAHAADTALPALPISASAGCSASAPCNASAAASEHEAPGHLAVAPARRGTTPNAEIESFARLGARGQHQRIVELAERQGFDSTIASANPADLLALGNAARFAGRANLAGMAYRALRDRFSKSSESAIAAFYLGRLNESSHPAQGIAWYERYVAEAPTGVWVAEALGRRMAILNESRPGPTTQAAAREYLSRFPSGPYAGFARKLLSP